MKRFEFDKIKKEVGAIGQGCMGIGGEFEKSDTSREHEVHCLKYGIELGMNFIDTASVYGNGNSEEIVGEAIKENRDEVFVATKFSPGKHNYDDVINSTEESLRRLKTEYIDLLQIHWPNPSVPLENTIGAMKSLVKSGKVLQIGVSNFSKRELNEVRKHLGEGELFSNQVEYNMFDRYIEKNIYPEAISNNECIVAYSPLDKGKKGNYKMEQTLNKMASKYDATRMQIVLNWMTTKKLIIPIPKATKIHHITDNATSTDFTIEARDLAEIEDNCRTETKFIDVNNILVSKSGEGNRKVYQTLEEALENKLNMRPSPQELAEDIALGEEIKPVRVIKSRDTNAKHDYELMEGRLRYWAWVIAHNGNKAVPCLER